MKVCILDKQSRLLIHDPAVNNCKCGNQIMLEIGDVVNVLPFSDKGPTTQTSASDTRMFQIICPVCFRGLTWENENWDAVGMEAVDGPSKPGPEPRG